MGFRVEDNDVWLLVGDMMNLVFVVDLSYDKLVVGVNWLGFGFRMFEMW